jgi:Fe-S cluster assembly iron-binding protein IscA
VLEIEGINVLIHERDYVHFDSTKLEYVEDVFGRGCFQLLKI